MPQKLQDPSWRGIPQIAQLEAELGRDGGVALEGGDPSGGGESGGGAVGGVRGSRLSSSESAGVAASSGMREASATDPGGAPAAGSGDPTWGGGEVVNELAGEGGEVEEGARGTSVATGATAAVGDGSAEGSRSSVRCGSMG